MGLPEARQAAVVVVLLRQEARRHEEARAEAVLGQQQQHLDDLEDEHAPAHARLRRRGQKVVRAQEEVCAGQGTAKLPVSNAQTDDAELSQKGIASCSEAERNRYAGCNAWRVADTALPTI